MRLALAQLDIEAGAVETNRERAEAAIAEAADRGADLVALPEIFTVGYFSFNTYERASEPIEGPTSCSHAASAMRASVGPSMGSDARS